MSECFFFTLQAGNSSKFKVEFTKVAPLYKRFYNNYKHGLAKYVQVTAIHSPTNIAHPLYFQNTMNCLYTPQTLILLLCCVVFTCIAMPLDLGVESDEEPADDLCSLCYIYEEPDICGACVLQQTSYPLEKRGPVFNPLLRGGYPKKSTYLSFNPLLRGTYNKKSPYRPIYHPFLRGGYGGTYPQQSQP